jgi:hypothetical protein
MLTTRFTAAAERTPRRIRMKKSQSPADDTATAAIVSPAPRAGKTAPRVEVMNTQ